MIVRSQARPPGHSSLRSGARSYRASPGALPRYSFFGLDALDDQLEDPFGLEPNDLALDAMTRTGEREMLWLLGETDLPPPTVPAGYILT